MMSRTEQTRTALLTGATGFVGSRLARRLAAGGWEVHVLVRPSSKLGELECVRDQVHSVVFDGNVAELTQNLRSIHPDVVFHLASLFLAQHKPEDIAGLVSSNITFGTQLLEAMTAAGIYNLVNTGTSWQHFEDADYNPVNLYAATKQAFEAVIRYYVETTPLKVITLKLFDTYGPEDPRPKLIHLLLKTAKNRQTLAMSPGEQMIDLVHVEDAVEAFEAGARRLLGGKMEGAHEQYAVSSGQPMRLRDVVATLAEAIGMAVPVQWGMRAYRPREVMRTWSRGQGVPDWRPRISLLEGFREVARHDAAFGQAEGPAEHPRCQ